MDRTDRGVSINHSNVAAYVIKIINRLQNHPTVFPSANFDAKQDATGLYKAMKGFGCDKKEVIEILANRNTEQRLEIAVAFKSLYGKVKKNFKKAFKIITKCDDFGYFWEF